jgi:hypothetical protein
MKIEDFPIYKLFFMSLGNLIPNTSRAATKYAKSAFLPDYSSPKTPIDNSRIPASRRVFLSFVRGNGWQCRFHADNFVKTPISRKFTFRDPSKIYEMVRRGNGFIDPDQRLFLDQAMVAGHGGIWLCLTDEQYNCLIKAGA